MTIVMNWTTPSGPAASVFGTFLGGVTAAEALQAMKDAWQLHLKSVVHSGTSLTSLTFLGPTPTELTVGEAGTRAGQASPPNSCYQIIKNMDSGRRSRWFLPGLAEDDTLANGGLTMAWQTQVTTKCNDFLGKLNTEGVALTVERKAGGFATVQSFTCSPWIGVQRRRLRRS